MRGVVVDPEHVVVCCAASQALTVLWHVLRKHGGRRVAIEDPGWRWQRYTAEAARLETVPIRVDADGLHLLAWLPEDADEHETAMRARRSDVGLHELHRHCTTHAPSPPALLLGFALPSESDLVAAVGLLAKAIC